MKCRFSLSLFYVAIVVLLTAGMHLFSPSQVYAAGTTYYVSPTGSDSASGTQNAPFQTLQKGVSLLSPGDTLVIGGGTYTASLDVSRSGTNTNPIRIQTKNNEQVTISQNRVNHSIGLSGNYIDVTGPIKITSSRWAGVQITGSHITVDNVEVAGSESHGIIATGKYITVSNSRIHNTVLENEPISENNQWGSGLKVSQGGEHIRFEGNTVYHNYGEGIAATMGKNIIIRNNRVYDNFAVNIYIDNSSDVIVENNFVTCDVDSDARQFYRNGSSGPSIALAEEQYSGWGNQLRNVAVRNNIAGFCSTGILYWGADSGSGGLRNVHIIQNTFYGIKKTPLSIEGESGTADSHIVNNIFHYTSSPPWVRSTSGLSIHHNFWAGTGPDAGTNARGSGDRTGNPGFVITPNATDPNSYRLNAASSAINAGANTETATDFLGIVRPQGAAFDMGAYEYTASNNANALASADYLQDGKITIVDFVLFMNYWYTNNKEKADLNDDGTINAIDYTIFMNIWYQFSQRL